MSLNLLKSIALAPKAAGYFSSKFKKQKERAKQQDGPFMWLAGLLFLCLLPGMLRAQVAIEWDKSLGATSAEEYQAMLQTSDGGYIVAGSSRSHIYGDKTEERKGEYDYWVVKISADGTKEWDKTIGGSHDDFLYSILQTPDGGYLLGGTSKSNADGDKSSNDRNFSKYPGDYWIVKLSANGNKQWDKTLGGNGLDDLRYMEMTSDGGFLLGGNSNSGDNGDKTERIRGERNDPFNSGPDFWIVKITADGTKQWDKTIGGGSGELLTAVHQSPDGGYVLGGTSFSNPGYDKQSVGKGFGSYWLVKLAADRSISWEKTFGGSGADRMTDFQYTSDGGYLLSGYSSSGKTGDKMQPSKGKDDYWVLKLNTAGTIQWQQTIGGAGDDRLQSVKQTPDGGYILGGYSESNAGFDKTENSRGEFDYWLVKIAGNGQTEWNKTIGSNGLDELRTMMPTPDGGYILGGNSDGGMSGDKTSQTNNENDYINTSKFWIVKFLPESTTNKLSLSTQSLTFTQVPKQTTAPQSVTLSASEGIPEISLTKPPVGWLKLPDPKLGNLAFSVDATGLLPGIYQAAVAMNAPGYIRTFVNITLIVKNATAAPVLAHIGKRTVIVDHTVFFDADATTDIGVTRRFSLVNAPEGAVIDPRNGNFSWTPPFTGTFTFGVKVTDSSPEALSDEEPVTINVLDIYKNDTIRINAGGKDFTTADGRMFKADAYFIAVDPRTSSIDSGEILNTTDDELYRTGRSSANFSYRIPVPDGNYNVVLHFAEIWFGAPGGRPGKRRFSVDIDGVRKLDNFDIKAYAGGAMKATQVTIPVSVTSGTIQINFNAGFVDMPRLAALEVLMTSRITKVRLPAIADSYVRSDEYANINYGSADTLFVRSRANKSLGFLKFSLGGLNQITSAKLRIYGTCNCIYRGGVVIKGVDDDSWTENGITWNNAPKTTTGSFDLEVVKENPRYYELIVTDYIRQQAAGDKVATLLLEWNNDTRNIFNSRENKSNPPELVIVTEGPVNTNTRLDQDLTSFTLPSDAGRGKSSIYPNPVQKQFSVEFSEKHSGAISLNIISQQGGSIPVGFWQQSKTKSKAEFDISQLGITKGMYLLKIESATETEVVRLLLTE